MSSPTYGFQEAKGVSEDNEKSVKKRCTLDLMYIFGGTKHRLLDSRRFVSLTSTEGEGVQRWVACLLPTTSYIS